VLLRAVGGSGAHPYPAAAAPAGVAGRASWQQLPCLTLPLAASSAARRGRGAASPAPSHLRGITCKAATGKLYGGLVAEQQQQVDKYIDILLDYNTMVNLTAVRDKDDAYDRHVEDSLALLPALDARAVGDGTTIIDVGTGGGLPGMIIAIARPTWSITLLDTLRKRVDFLESTVEKLGLKNVRCVWSRAEDAGRAPPEREAYDISIARAVAETRILAELCLPFVKVGGHWVAAKGAEEGVNNEIDAAGKAFQLLGAELVGVELVDSYGGDGQRTAVVVRKSEPMAAKYPRRAGMANKRPL